MLDRFRRKPERYPKPYTAEQLAYFDTEEGRAELFEYFKTPEGAEALRRSMRDEVYEQEPTLREAVPVDAAAYASLMMGPLEIKQGLPLFLQIVQTAWESDAFLCMLLYRIRVRLLVHSIPLLPTVLHRLCMVLAQVDIGDKVVLQPGVYIPHGQVVIDGKVVIGSGTSIGPWVTIGLAAVEVEGPTIGAGVFIGTGAKILGRIRVGEAARIGANSVVLRDVEPQTTVVGAPAKVVRDRRA